MGGAGEGGRNETHDGMQAPATRSAVQWAVSRATFATGAAALPRCAQIDRFR